jgi:hypothetical protein
MVNGTKVYNIKINGLQESVTAADALISKLDALERRLDALSKSGLKIGSSSGGGSKDLDAQASLLDKIAKAEEKVEEARDRNYQYLLKIKDELKEVTTLQKANTAASKLNDNNYALDTMEGMKAKLKDIKALMQTTPTGSTLFAELVSQADQLTSDLKKIETAYGQFGRNVGNYSSAFSGLTEITVTIGDTERKFKNATSASRELKNELKALYNEGKENTKEFKDLSNAIDELDRKTKGMSSTMDSLLNVMQSIGAIASISGGLGALFGNKNNDIQKSIQQLVALQNVLQGIETLRKQMDTNKGIGAILAAGNNSVDRFVASLTKAKIETEGLTMASRGATIAVRSLSTALKAIGVGVAIAGITALLSLFSKASKAMAEGVNQATAFNTQLETLNKNFATRNDQLMAQYIGNAISKEEYYNEVLKNQNKYIAENIKLLDERSRSKGWASSIGEAIGGEGFNRDSLEVRITGLTSSQTIRGIDELRKKFSELNGEMRKGVGFFDDIFGVTSRNLVTTGNRILGDYINRLEDVSRAYQSVDANADDASAKFQAIGKNVQGLIDELNSDEILQSIVVNLDKYIPDEATRQAIQNIIGYVTNLNDVLNTGSTKFQQSMNQWRIDAMKDGYAKSLAEIDKAQKEEEAKWVGNQEALNAIEAKYARQRQEIWKQEKKARLDSDNELMRLRIEKMRDGFAKTMAELDNEEKQRIRQAEESERNVQEKVTAIQELYTEKRLQAYKEYREKVLDTNREFNEELRRLNEGIGSMQFDTAEMFNNNQMNEDLKQFIKNITTIENMFSRLPNAINANQFSKKTIEMLGLKKEDVSKISEDYKLLLETSEAYYGKMFEVEAKYAKAHQQNEENRLKFDLENRKREYEEEYRLQKERLLEARRFEIDSLENDETYEMRKQLILDKYNQFELKAEELHKERMKALEDNYQQQIINTVTETNEKIQESNAQRFQSEIINYERFYAQLATLQANQPTLDRSGWNIVDIAATKKNYKAALDGYKELSNGIKNEKQKLQDALEKNEISFGDFTQANMELDNLQDSVNKATDNIAKNSKNLVGDFISSINTYVQALGSGLQNVLSSVYAYEDSVYNKQKETLEKNIQEYEEALQKQQDMTQKYADNINSIEDELSTARGDRRQQLIDMLNQQKAAQRASLNEEKKIEKEKEKMEAKQEQLELEQKKREHKRQITDAIISAALAVVNGLATKPFVPVGIAMGALAGALGAVQVALIKSQKYASGGVIEGASHNNGGVKVLGGRAEVEGGEYITNKQTTQKNVQLLDFINSKKKRIDLDDLVEFYGGGLRRQVKAVKSKFADGGQLPTLRGDISINDRFVRALEAYENKPTVVSVVEIMDKTKDVRNVQAIAGLTDE